MPRPFWLYVLICFHYNHGSHGSMEAILLPGTTTYSNYTGECQQRPDVENDDHLASMKEIMSSKNINATWLPIRKRDFGQWEWLTGEFYQKFITHPDYFRPGLDCAVLRSEDSLIDDVPCVSNYSHYMCQAQSSCDARITATGTKCFMNGKNAYYLYNDQGNWFDAVDRCTGHNQTLASLTSSERTAIMNKVKEALGKAANIWLGLRQKDYYLELSASKSRLLTKHHWNRTALCLCPEKNCVVLTQTSGGKFSWKQEDCSSRHSYFCLQKVDSATPKYNISGGVPSANTSPWWWFHEYYWLIIIGAACVGGTLLIIILTGICFCCCLRKSEKDRSENVRRRKEEDYKVLEVEPEANLIVVTSTPVKSEPPKPAPRGKPSRPSLENLDKVGLTDDDEKVHLMNSTDKENHTKDAVLYTKGEYIPPVSASEGEGAKEGTDESKKGPVRPHYTEEELLNFRRQAQKKMPPEYFQWIMWNLADAVVKIRSLEKRAELFDLLNVPKTVCSFTVGDKSAKAEDIYPILQHWSNGKKPQKAWKDLQRIINKEYTLLKPWLDDIESSSAIVM